MQSDPGQTPCDKAIIIHKNFRSDFRYHFCVTIFLKQPSLICFLHFTMRYVLISLSISHTSLSVSLSLSITSTHLYLIERHIHNALMYIISLSSSFSLLLCLSLYLNITIFCPVYLLPFTPLYLSLLSLPPSLSLSFYISLSPSLSLLSTFLFGVSNGHFCHC